VRSTPMFQDAPCGAAYPVGTSKYVETVHSSCSVGDGFVIGNCFQ
jgi:hypothetical protein